MLQCPPAADAPLPCCNGEYVPIGCRPWHPDDDDRGHRGELQRPDHERQLSTLRALARQEGHPPRLLDGTLTPSAVHGQDEGLLLDRPVNVPVPSTSMRVPPTEPGSPGSFLVMPSGEAVGGRRLARTPPRRVTRWLATSSRSPRAAGGAGTGTIGVAGGDTGTGGTCVPN